MEIVHKEGTSSTLARGLMILEVVAKANQRRGVTLQEVSKSLGFHRSNVYRYLTTLCETGWLEHDGETYRYRLGHKPLQVAVASLQQMDLRTIARPFLEELAGETCLAVHLAVLNQASIVYLDKIEPDSPIQMRSRPGMVAPSYSTAVGKAMLVTKTPDEIRALIPEKIPPRTSNTLTTVDDLLVCLSETRRRGYAIDLEENELGIGCVGAAIYGFDDEIVAGVSVSTLIQQLTPERISELGNKVMKAARRISQSMGCPHNHWVVNREENYF